MYPVSELYKEKIRENSRIFELAVLIQHATGALVLTDKDLAVGTLTYTESSQAGEEFTIGSTVASDISFAILNKPEYENINFMGATVWCFIGLVVKEFINWSDLTSYTWDDLKSYTWNDLKRMRATGTGTVEYVPLGIFNIDYVNKQRNTIQIKAIDNMINLDKPYSLSELSYPATLYQIYVNICNVADVNVGTTSFPNMDYMVNTKPDGDLTLRDVLGYVAELAGCFAKCNRNGALELKWYEQTDIELGPANRFNFKPSDDEVRIKGVMYTIDDTTYLAGSEDYAIDLSENPLVSGNYSTLLNNIYNNVKDTVFVPYTSDWQGDPAIEAGDMIVQVDRDGKVYNTLVTRSTYKYRGRSVLEAKGLPEISRGYKGSINKKITNIVRKKIKPIGDQLSTLEQAQLNAMQLMSNMLGGHLIEDKANGILYIADNPDLEQATKIWKWGPGGFGYSEDGGQTWKTAITADGSIVAMLVAANIITADMIQAGLLQSMDGSTWINLDDGTFNFKNMVKIVDGQLRLESPDIPDVGVIEGEISNIKNLTPGSLQGGIVTIDNERVRVEHTGANQYSELRADGFVRGYPNGEAKYLNDIYVYNYVTSNAWFGGEPDPINIQLPRSFKNRGNDVDIYLAQTGWAADIGYVIRTEYPNLDNLTRELKTVLEVESTDFTLDRPIVSIKNYLEQWYYRMFQGNWQSRTDYRHISFMLFVIGK